MEMTKNKLAEIKEHRSNRCDELYEEDISILISAIEWSQEMLTVIFACANVMQPTLDFGKQRDNWSACAATASMAILPKG